MRVTGEGIKKLENQRDVLYGQPLNNIHNKNAHKALNILLRQLCAQ